VASLASPELTGTWESRLARIARGEDTRGAFMADIARYVADLVGAIRSATPPPPPAGQPPPRTFDERGASERPQRTQRPPRPARPRAAAPARAPRRDSAPTEPLACPRCDGAVIAGARGWGCSRWKAGCTFVVWFETAGRRLSAAQLRELVTRGRTRKGQWVTERGATIAGRLVLDPTARGGAARLEPA
jgi:DNA topoisomerase-3